MNFFEHAMLLNLKRCYERSEIISKLVSSLLLLLLKLLSLCYYYYHYHLYCSPKGVERRAVWNAEEEAWTVQKLVHIYTYIY
jgi:hypothetical protein